ncbi:MAG: PEGA domain-containing protein [Sandaracinaceae bacterium]|nr:PEGA domain-containing protein [Sandaracinaceae bacterium]
MRALALSLVLFAIPVGARASSVVVVIGDAPDPGALRAAVVEAIAERGLRLVRVPDGRACDEGEGECLAALAAQTGADATLRVEILGGAPPRVRAHLVRPTGAPAEAIVEIPEGGLDEAVARAVTRAFEAAPPATGFVLVRSSPSGARVEVEGIAYGATPLRLTLPAGEHAVTVVHPTAGTQQVRARVTSGEEAQLLVEIGATAEPGATAPAGPRVVHTERSPFNWVIGGALAIGGVVALISPLSTLAREGQCHEEIEDVGCVEMIRVGAQTGILLGTGLALLVAAVVVDVVAPIRVEVSASPAGARIGVEGRF